MLDKVGIGKIIYCLGGFKDNMFGMNSDHIAQGSDSLVYYLEFFRYGKMVGDEIRLDFDKIERDIRAKYVESLLDRKLLYFLRMSESYSYLYYLNCDNWWENMEYWKNKGAIMDGDVILSVSEYIIKNIIE